MTHAELTGAGHAGLFASACPGELAHHGDFPDDVVTSEGTTTRTVSLYHCRGCGHFLSVTEGVVFNCYPPPGRLAALRTKGEG